jgi:hypothetical protein
MLRLRREKMSCYHQRTPRYPRNVTICRHCTELSHTHFCEIMIDDFYAYARFYGRKRFQNCTTITTTTTTTIDLFNPVEDNLAHA